VSLTIRRKSGASPTDTSWRSRVRPACFDDLELAHALIGKGQDPAYWAAYPIPRRPLGRVFLEPWRQLATFLLPVALVGCCLAGLGISTIFLTLPSALLMGWLLDRQLQRAIQKKMTVELELDKDRYRVVRILSASLRVPPEMLTLDLVQSMADAHERQLSLERREAELNKRKRQAARARNELDGAREVTSESAAMRLSESQSSDRQGSAQDWDKRRDWEPAWPAVNPTSGLPMMSGDMFGVDVAGHTYGSDF